MGFGVLQCRQIMVVWWSVEVVVQLFIGIAICRAVLGAGDALIICKFSDRELEVVEVLTQLGKLAPAKLCNDLTDWNIEQGLLFCTEARSTSPKIKACA